jgi:phosphate transport system protein
MDDVPSSELRRSYHDHIAALHSRSADLVRSAASAAAGVRAAFLDGDEAAGERTASIAAEAAMGVAGVETEVLELLALQSPVARDLRMILASRDIAEAARLCLGLCKGLAERVGCAREVLTPELRDMIAQMGTQTVDLLERAAGAWDALDEEQVKAVVTGANASRQVQRAFITALLELHVVPVEAGVDLGTTSRLYERLTDHVLEIVRQVSFVITGVATLDASSTSDSLI